jgi:predicted hydrocarbon binding protein
LAEESLEREMLETMGDMETLQGRLRALSETLAIMNLAGEEVTGRSAPQLMYFAAKDLGLKEAAGFDCTDDIEVALGWVFSGPQEVWKVSLWKNKEDDDFWVYEVEEMYLRLLFEACPVRESCLAAGVKLGGVACQAVHGYAAGVLEKVFGRRVDFHTEHMGPGACLVMLKTNLE